MRKVSTIFLVLLPAAVLMLGALPNAQVLEFSVPGQAGEVHRFFYSYYSAVPAAYGNLCGLLTVGLSAVLLGVYWMLLVRPYSPARLAAPLIGCGAVAASVINVLFGCMTGIGWCISVLLLIHTVLAFMTRKKL